MKVDYEIRAIEPDVLKELRDSDDMGNPPRQLAVRDGGHALRCCPRRSEPGDGIALLSYAPLRRWAASTGADPGPYGEVGPVFVHADACDGPEDTGYPLGMHGDRRVLRAYSADGEILGGRFVETGGSSSAGSQDVRAVLEEQLADMYRDPEVAAVHARAVEFGCFLFETRRV